MTFFFILSLININLLDFSYLRFSSNTNIMFKKIVFAVLIALTFMSNQNIFSQSFNDISGVDFMSLNDS